MSPNCPDGIELHRPYIDEVTVTCPVCGKQMKRVPEVIDCWFDSGAMPFAQHHYPFENKELFDQQFPAKFISEAVDQTRGWFYSLLAISTLLFNKAPFKNVIVLGHVQDQFGQKMSKSKGNATAPSRRWRSTARIPSGGISCLIPRPGCPINSTIRRCSTGSARFLGTLYNTYAFYVLYADIYQFDPTKHPLEQSALTVMDRWILSPPEPYGGRGGRPYDELPPARGGALPPGFRGGAQ